MGPTTPSNGITRLPDSRSVRVSLSRLSVPGTPVGARIVAIDVRDDPLELARDLGAEATVNAAALGDGADGPAAGDESSAGTATGTGSDRGASVDRGVPAEVRAITDGGATVSIDALGRAETARNAVDCLRRRGRHVQVGLTTDAERGEVPLPTDRMTSTEVDWYGARGMPPPQYGELLSLLESGAVAAAGRHTAVGAHHSRTTPIASERSSSSSR
jgi:alcohol dehydrogenase